MGDWDKAVDRMLSRAGDRGGLIVADGALGAAADLAGRAEAAGLTFAEVDVPALSALPGGVVVALGGSLLGRPGVGNPDDSFCNDAVGDGSGARASWAQLKRRWAGLADPGEGLLLPPDDEPWRSSDEILRRVLVAIGDVERRCVLLHGAASLPDDAHRALRGLLCGGPAAGWVFVFEGPLAEAAEALANDVQRSADDPRVPAAAFARLDAPAAEADEGSVLPKRGSAVELLDILAAAPGPVPAAVVGSRALAEYRGTAPRSGWIDLDAIVDSGRGELHGPLAVVPAAADSRPLVSSADCRALRRAVAEVLTDGDATRLPFEAELAAAAGDHDAGALLMRAARSALAEGLPSRALAFAESAAGRPLGDEGGALDLAVLRTRALRAIGRPEEARRLGRDALDEDSLDPSLPMLQLELGLAAVAVGRRKAAIKLLDAAARTAEDASLLEEASAAAFAHGLLEEDGGDPVAAAKVLARAARTAEQAGDTLSAARAFAWRAVAMGKAGAKERAMKELKLALERASDPNDPRPAALSVRTAMALVFRDAGSRDKARQALGLAADKAAEHAAPVAEAEARLHLSRFLLEALPATGKERGEALRDGRQAAETTLRLARAHGLLNVEAESEALLGELSWRGEDFDGALASLSRQAALWEAVGRSDRQVDVAIRSSRLAARQTQWPAAFDAANKALMLATKRRLPEQSAQAQMARAEALEGMDRSDEALAAYSEAKRVFSGLGEEHAAHARAAERRSQQLIEKGRG